MWEQLEARYAGKLKTIKTWKKNHCFLKARGAPRWAQEGSRNYLAGFCRCSSPLLGPILNPSWAILGPPWPFSGGPGGHLEAYFGLGRLASGVQGGQKTEMPKTLKNLREIKVFGGPALPEKPQDCFKIAPERPKMVQDVAKLAHASPKLAPRWPK